MTITLTLLVPVLTAILLLCIPKDKTPQLRMTALFGSLATLAFSLALLGRFDSANAGFQFIEEYKWVPSLKINYHVGLDGISLFLVVLSALLTPIAILCSWKSVEKRVREFHIALLLLTSGVIGVFVALDLMLFYVFWEVMLIPMYLLIGVWGSTERIRAAVKFFIYTMAGSLLMFLAILYLYKYTGTFSVEEIYKNQLTGTAGMLCFLAFALSFAIKVPLFPVHTWLPDAHTEAPTAGSVILAGVLLKLGIYGFIRFAIPFFPEAASAAAPWISILAIVGIIFGALMCFVQEDMKRLIAYSSVSRESRVAFCIWSTTASPPAPSSCSSASSTSVVTPAGSSITGGWRRWPRGWPSSSSSRRFPRSGFPSSTASSGSSSFSRAPTARTSSTRPSRAWGSSSALSTCCHSTGVSSLAKPTGRKTLN